MLGELGVEQPLLVATERLAGTNLGVRTAARWSEVPSDQVADCGRARRRRRACARRRQRDRHGEGDLGRRERARSSPSRRRTRAPSGRPSTGCATLDRKMRGGGAGAQLGGDRLRPELTLDAAACGDRRHRAERARARCEALYVEGRNAEADRHALAGAAVSSATGFRASSTRRRTSRRATKLLRGAAMHRGGARRFDARAWRTRWRRRSAAATGCRTAR